MNEYEKWEKDCILIRQQNEKIMNDFAGWLEKSGLKDATINKHCWNVDLYINEFLLYEDAIPAKEGASYIEMFLGYWFIRKAMWSSVASIKQNAASLKKFYQFMLERNEIEADEFEKLKKTIKENMPEWLETMKRYDDIDLENFGL